MFPLAPAALEDVLGAIGPREVLVADSVMAHPDVARATQGLTLTPRPDARADAKLGERLFRDAYGVSTLDGFGTFTRAELIACALLFDYLAVTQAGGQARLDPPIRTAPDTFLAIDPATRASLEIERSTRGAAAGLAGRRDRPHRHRRRRAAAGPAPQPPLAQPRRDRAPPRCGGLLPRRLRQAASSRAMR